MADKREEILEGILALPVLDVAWLVKELEDKFGVSAAAPVQVLSLIHISEPTRRYAISYDVFC